MHDVIDIIVERLAKPDIKVFLKTPNKIEFLSPKLEILDGPHLRRILLEALEAKDGRGKEEVPEV
jgi:hypothetical protein